MAIPLVLISLQVQAAAAAPQNQKLPDTFEEKTAIMKDDENEDTDTLAIPLDDSNVEDEIQINIDQKKNPNDLNLSPYINRQ